MRLFSALCQLLLLLAVSGTALAEPADDPHSYAQPRQVTIKAMHLDLAADFDSRTLSGSVELAWTGTSARELVLDTRDLHHRARRGAPRPALAPCQS